MADAAAAPAPAADPQPDSPPTDASGGAEAAPTGAAEQPPAEPVAADAPAADAPAADAPAADAPASPAAGAPPPAAEEEAAGAGEAPGPIAGAGQGAEGEAKKDDVEAAALPPGDEAPASPSGAPAAAEDAPAGDTKTQAPASPTAAPTAPEDAAAADPPGGQVDDPASPKAAVAASPGAGAAMPAADDPASPSAAGELTVERIDVDPATVDVATTQNVAVMGRMKEAVDAMLAACDKGIEELQEGEQKEAMLRWRSEMERHVQDLEGIASASASPSGRGELTAGAGGVHAASGDGGGEEGQLVDQLEGVRDIRLQLESERTGRDMEDCASVWNDPADTEREIGELRRARRQIRYLFGGMVGNLPETANMRVSELIHSDAEDSPRNNKGIDGGYAAAVANAVSNMGAAYGIEAGSSAGTAAGKPPAMPGELIPHLPLSPKLPGHTPRRPRSSGTELSSVTSSQGDDEERRRRDRHREKKERKLKKRDSSQGANASTPRKKDDGAYPKTHWNWADEVVKASLDPQNSWEFPSGQAPLRGANDGGQNLPAWEVPRQQRVGDDVAARARERAQEVLRSERDMQHRIYSGR
eukprot:TRINITY_DN36202_c0_g1_i1.p1 TRINITY_DN36202_c0_g1~~TRINITY_DN36202_c0_g1_i1.p1  ORF type:complete len:587 (-),score=169.22 TRINITY_DN36202_c0_g1_i1:346-2106(-)